MKQKELFIISLTIFLTIVAWIVSDINHVINTESIRTNTPVSLEPINLNIDLSIFDTLQNRK